VLCKILFFKYLNAKYKILIVKVYKYKIQSFKCISNTKYKIQWCIFFKYKMHISLESSLKVRSYVNKHLVKTVFWSTLDAMSLVLVNKHKTTVLSLHWWKANCADNDEKQRSKEFMLTSLFRKVNVMFQ